MRDQSKFIAPTYGPDIAQREQQAKRRQMMAQALQQRGMESPQGQMVSGHYVAPSWTQYLAQGLNSYLGGKEARGADDDMQAARQMGRDQMLGQFGFGQPSPQQLAQGLSNDQPQVGIDDGGAGFTPAQGGMPQGPEPMLIPGLDRQQSLTVLENVGGQEYAKLLAQHGAHRGTSAMQNAAAMGLQPGTPEYNAYIERSTGKPQTTVNVGQSEYGTIPPGFELFTDPQTGARSMRPISGGPVDREEQEAAARAEAAKTNAANYARTVTQDIGIALEELENYGTLSRMDNPVGGIAAETSARIPRTSEYNMKQFVDSALSNVTLDTMNRMRETSPAGATGFGNMSERQMEVIRGVLGQWKPGLPVDQQRYILHRLHNFYMDVVVGSKEERDQAVRDGRMTRAEADAMDDLYYPETRDLKGRALDQSQPGGGQAGQRSQDQQGRTVVRTGRTPDGRRVVQYSDGTIEYSE